MRITRLAEDEIEKSAGDGWACLAYFTVPENGDEIIDSTCHTKLISAHQPFGAEVAQMFFHAITMVMITLLP